jgi:nitroreductase
MRAQALIGLATRRKTARKFAKTPVSMEDVLYSIRVAVQAPSGANRQPWRFLIVDDRNLRGRIRAACEDQEKFFHAGADLSLQQWFQSKNINWDKPFLTDAPLLLAVFSDQDIIYATESTWLALGYIILALEEKGLATVVYTPPHPKDLRSLFNAPLEFRLETVLPIGYSADPKPKEERRPLESFIFRNFWNRSA